MEKKYLNRKSEFYMNVLRIATVFFITILSTGVKTMYGAVPDSLSQSLGSEELLVYTVKGNVVNSGTKEGFAGVRVSVVNTRLTTMTDENGDFEMKVPNLDVTLALDVPGFQNQLVSLRGRSSVEIQMLLDGANNSNFYNDNILSAEKSYSLEDFTKGIVSIDQDIASRLNGEVRGITHSGLTGGGAAFFYRGINSLNVNAQPLFVVDGVIWQNQDDVSAVSMHEGFFNNPLALIDPNDIEKITVLKDGTSLYGSKGGNGVILIQTKRAKNMATEISANIFLGYRQPLKSIPVMDASEYRLYASDVLKSKYQNTSLVEKYKFLDDDDTKSYYKANHNNTDWLDVVGGGALTQNYTLGVRGGDEIALYAFSIGYSKNEGNIDETDFSRLNMRFNSDINLAKKLKLSYDISFAQVDNKIFNDGIDEILSPYYLSLIKSPLYYPYQYEATGNVSRKLSDVDELEVANPLALIKNADGSMRRYRFNINTNLSYSILDNLNASVLFGYSWDKVSENSFRPNYGIGSIELVNELDEVYDLSRNMVKEYMSRHSSVFFDVRMNWNVLKNSLHNFDVFGGYKYYYDTYGSEYAQGHNTSSDNVRTLESTNSNLRSTSGLDEKWKSMSWYASADYSLKNRYLLNVTAAMDASSRFGKEADDALKLGGVAWGIFPSVSAGWVLSSENFMQNVDFVNFLKLNAGYGLAGNDNIVNYATRTYFSSVHVMGKAMGITLENIGNEKLKWETTATARVGLDMSLFNNRWSVSADFYTANTKDLLTRKLLNDVAGVKYYWSNDGELENKGFEIATNVRIMDSRDWKVDFGAMIGHYKNKVKSLANGDFVTDIYGGQVLTAEGNPAGVFYGYKTKGVFSTAEEAANANLYIVSKTGEQIPFKAGDMYFENTNNDNIIDENDRQIIGDPNPDFYGNFNFGVTYKRFTLSALFTYSYGNDAYNALRANLESGSDIYNQATSLQNRWVAEGQVTNIPRAVYGDPMGNARFSDRWIEDASYLRFKSLALSYEVPINSPFIQGVTVWGSVNNLYTWTKYLGSDPEFSYGNNVLYQGIDAGLIPQTRAFNFGVKINL